MIDKINKLDQSVIQDNLSAESFIGLNSNVLTFASL